MKLKKYKTSLQYQKFWFWFEIQRKVFLSFFLQEEKNSRKLIQPDLLAMSQLLNFDEVRQPHCGRADYIRDAGGRGVWQRGGGARGRRHRGQEGGAWQQLGGRDDAQPHLGRGPAHQDCPHQGGARGFRKNKTKAGKFQEHSWPDFLPGPPTFRVSGPTLLLLYEQ